MNWKAFLLTLAAPLVSCTAEPAKPLAEKQPIPETAETLVVAAGCFWCVEEIYEEIPGVYEAVSGFTGGPEKNPTYEQVSAGATGHTEAVEIYYDPEVTNVTKLLKPFWASFDYTNGRGVAPDFGSQYRPELFYSTDEEKKAMEMSKAEAAKLVDKPVAVPITKLEKFYPASDYHQDFARRNPSQGYVKAVSIPRLKRTLKALGMDD